MIVGSVVLFCIAALLFFVLTGIGIIILGMSFFIWTIILLILFPFLLPLLLPLLIVLIFISLVRKRQLQKK